tara:strand:+ start:3411 stop:3662 length:252 start_codon:yes stop_codon:yes gene_type:complete
MSDPVKNIIIRSIDYIDNDMLNDIKKEFNIKTNSQALLKAGHKYLSLRKEVNRLMAVEREHEKLKADCGTMLSAQDRIKNLIS